MIDDEFTFKRDRGIVWVCDIKNSSKVLNDDYLIDDFEVYLKRFYWLSRRIVESADGVYIKWTGDGFLAWFPCKLKRKLAELSNVVLTAAYHLSMLNNVTQLNTNIKEKILLRHGVTFEEDAQMTIINSKDLKATDIIGRNVVLAFRLSSFEHFFPNITIHGDLVFEDSKFKDAFKKMEINEEILFKVFKGQKYQIDNLYELDITNSLKRNKNKPLKKILKDTIDNNDNIESPLDKRSINLFHNKFDEALRTGPDWANNIYRDNTNHIKEMYNSIKNGYKKIT